MVYKKLILFTLILIETSVFASPIKIIKQYFGHSPGAKNSGFVVIKDEVRTLPK